MLTGRATLLSLALDFTGKTQCQLVVDVLLTAISIITEITSYTGITGKRCGPVEAALLYAKSTSQHL
jgi:hypothetical protein